MQKNGNLNLDLKSKEKNQFIVDEQNSLRESITYPYSKKIEFTNSFYLYFLTCCVLFIGGLSYGLLDVMNKNLQIHLDLKNVGLIQGIYFSCYLLISIPSGLLSQKIGFRYGMIVGLSVFAVGALTITVAASSAIFYIFLLAFFVMACGVVVLDANTNPTLINLGSTHRSNLRINLGQAIGSIGVFVGPFIGGKFFMTLVLPSEKAKNLENVAIVYFIMAMVSVVLIAFLVTAKTPKSEQKKLEEQDQSLNPFNDVPLWKIKHFVFGFIAVVLYAFAQVGTISNFIPYTLHYWVGINDEKAAYLLGVGTFFFLLGRLFTTPLFRFWNGHQILTIYAVLVLLLMVLIGLGINIASVIALIVIMFLFSISYPTIFAMAIAHLPSNKVKLGAALIAMGSIGGAIGPFAISFIGNYSSYAIGMMLLVPCYLFIAWYAVKGSRVPNILFKINNR